MRAQVIRPLERVFNTPAAHTPCLASIAAHKAPLAAHEHVRLVCLGCTGSRLEPSDKEPGNSLTCKLHRSQYSGLSQRRRFKREATACHSRLGTKMVLDGLGTESTERNKRV